MFNTHESQEDLDRTRIELEEIRRRGTKSDVEFYDKKIKKRKRLRRLVQLIWLLGGYFSYMFIFTGIKDDFDSEVLAYIASIIWAYLYAFKLRCPPDDIWIKWGNN